MRQLLVLCLLVLAGPASASADYRLLGDVSFPDEQEIAIAGGEVLAGSYADERDALLAFGLDGSRRTLVPLGRRGLVYAVAASPEAFAAVTSRGPRAGPLSGPPAPLPGEVEDVAVSGSTVLTLERDAIVALEGGVPRVVTRPGKDPAVLEAAGPYVSVAVNHEAEDSAIVVYEIATGREVYRVPTIAYGYDLGPDGRLVFVGSTHGRVPIRTATPAEPLPRTIAELPVTPYVALAGDTIALARRGSVSELLLVGLDGTARTVSGTVGRVGSIAYDGTTLAFTAGRCLYAGSGPASPSTTDGCFDRAPLLRRWRLRGRRLIARLDCRVPPGARCAGVLRLLRRGRVVERRRLNLRSGRHVVRLRVARALVRPPSHLLLRVGHARRADGNDL